MCQPTGQLRNALRWRFATARGEAFARWPREGGSVRGERRRRRFYEWLRAEQVVFHKVGDGSLRMRRSRFSCPVSGGD